MENNLLKLFLEAEKERREISVILDSEIAYELACELKDEYDRKFNEECYPCEDLLQEDILSVSMYYDSDEGYVYFIENTLADNGDTLISESNSIYIQDELLDCLELEKLIGEKYIIKMVDDEDYANEEDEDLDELLEQITQDLLEELEDEENCIHCTIKEYLKAMVDLGFEIGIGKDFKE